MSEHDRPLDPELRDLADQLDAAFAATRPSPGYADRLRARLPGGEPRAPEPAPPPPPWWRPLARPRTLVPALSGVAALAVVAIVGVATYDASHAPHSTPGGSGRLSTAAPAMASPSCPTRISSASPGARPTPTPTPSPGRESAAARSPSTRC